MNGTYSNAAYPAESPDLRNLRAFLNYALPQDTPMQSRGVATFLSWLQEGREFYVLVGSKGDGRWLRKLLYGLPDFRRYAALRGIVRICPIFKPGRYLILDPEIAGNLHPPVKWLGGSGAYSLA